MIDSLRNLWCTDIWNSGFDIRYRHVAYSIQNNQISDSDIY